MNLLFFSQLMEFSTASILVLVLMMLYYFGNLQFIRDLRMAFVCYLLVLVVTLFEGESLFSSWVEYLQYYLLITSAYYIYISVLKQEEKSNQKRLIYFFRVVVFAIPLLMKLLNVQNYIEGVGYGILGFTLLATGILWMRTKRFYKTMPKLVGAGLIVFGLHLTGFILVQYNDYWLIIGFAVAAAIEAYLALAFVLLNFRYLKGQDEANYKRYLDLFNNSTDAILMLDHQLIYDCNIKAVELFGIDKSTMIGLSPMDFSASKQENERKSTDYGEELFAGAQEGKTMKFEWVYQNSSGKRTPCYSTLFPIGDHQYGVVIRDMTYKYSYEEELNFHKYYDGLTQLPKRALFIDRLDFCLEEYPEKVALIAFNIDNFRQINDQYGHEYGDELLLEVVKRVKGTFKKGFTMTRLGGDQFVVLMDRLSHHNRVYIPLEHIESVFRRPFDIYDERIDVSACMGVAFPEEEGTTAMGLLKNVDLALTIAKKNGRNSLEFYSSDGKEEFNRRIAIEKAMNLGLEEAAFIPYYQPIVDPYTNQIMGAEALARWQQKDGEMIYPDVFIPVAEETGLINAIGEQILRQACMACKAILTDSPEFVMHVNLSAHQLQEMTIVAKIKHVLDVTELEARHLAVEITETTLIEDGKRVNEVLAEIKNLGVQVALDDFGTGYSSLSYLTEMQVDTIKIDRKFVLKLPKDPKANALMGFLKSLVHELGYEIVVEGVEEKEQLDFLMDLGCDYIQGYYFYRPMGYKALKALLDESCL